MIRTGCNQGPKASRIKPASASGERRHKGGLSNSDFGFCLFSPKASSQFDVKGLDRGIQQHEAIREGGKKVGIQARQKGHGLCCNSNGKKRRSIRGSFISADMCSIAQTLSRIQTSVKESFASKKGVLYDPVSS
jgi:hypothetical protein